MLKGILGAVSGSFLYVFANSAHGGERIGCYLAGMVLLAGTARWVTAAVWRSARATSRSVVYVVRSRLATRMHEPTHLGSWQPLVATTRTIFFEEGPSTEASRVSVSA